MLLNGPRESFTIEEIGDRDGWVCQICLDPVDPAFQAPDPRSPSADHIRAITLGGTHTRANVRITHLFCNMDRNDHSDEPRGTVVIKGRHGDAIEITTLDRGDIDKPRRRRLVLKDERGNVISDHTYMVTPTLRSRRGNAWPCEYTHFMNSAQEPDHNSRAPS